MDMERATRYVRDRAKPVEQDAREIISQLVKNGVADWEIFWMYDERYIYMEI